MTIFLLKPVKVVALMVVFCCVVSGLRIFVLHYILSPPRFLLLSIVPHKSSSSASLIIIAFLSSWGLILFSLLDIALGSVGLFWVCHPSLLPAGCQVGDSAPWFLPGTGIGAPRRIIYLSEQAISQGSYISFPEMEELSGFGKFNAGRDL